MWVKVTALSFQCGEEGAGQYYQSYGKGTGMKVSGGEWAEHVGTAVGHC